MTTHDSWTDQLSEYLDDELTPEERSAVEAHIAGCSECARTLAALKRVVATAATLIPAAPERELWSGIAERIEPGAVSRLVGRQRISFTLPQLAAASLLLATLSGGAVALMLRNGRTPQVVQDETTAPGAGEREHRAELRAGATDVPLQRGDDAAIVPALGYADAQYDAAVADLERALRNGRGRLDQATVSIVEENLAIIDRAISEARGALDADPSNGYLSGHLMEARRRKLDLLRRAAELTQAN